MKRLRYRTCIFVCVVLALCQGELLLGQSRPEPKAIKITLLYLNDVNQFTAFDEGRRGSLGRVSTLRKELMKTQPNVLFVHAGNTLSPSSILTDYKGQQMVDAWNAIGLDIAGVGARDFDIGEEELRQRIVQSRFRWVASNFDGRSWEISDREIRQFEGVKIGFFSVLSPKLVLRKSPNIRIRNPVDSASETVKALQKDGVNIIIALTTMNLREDRDLVQRVPGIDVVIGANAVTMVQMIAGRTPIFKTSGNARELGFLDLTVNAQTGKLESIDSRMILVTSQIPEDPQFSLVTNKYSKDLFPGPPGGTTTVELDATRLSNSSRETNVGNLLTDIMRDQADTDVAIINGGAIGLDALISPGRLTYSELSGLLPNSGDLIKVSVSGSTLRQLLEDSVSEVESDVPSGTFPQVSGMYFTFTTSRPPNSRVLNVSIKGEPLKDTKTYTLATFSNISIAASLVNLPHTSGKSLIKILLDELSPDKQVSPKVQGRIIQLLKN
jgi:5'-nucleotidase